MSTLTDRYVYAATRFVADKDERQNLDRELRERITDTAEDLQSSGLAADDAEQRALQTLGDPLQVAATYRGTPMHLVGPRFYFLWQRTTVIALAIILPILAAVDALGRISDGAGVGPVAAGAVVTALTGAVHTIFWTTAVFAIVERLAPQAADSMRWTPEQLPELPTSASPHRIGDTVAGLLFLGLFAALLVWQHFGSPIFDGGERIPILDPELWNTLLPFVFGLIVVEMAQTVWVFRAGYTRATAVLNAVVCLGWVGIGVWLFTSDTLFNPQFVEHLGWSGATLTATWVAVIVVAISVWDAVDGFVKASRRTRPAA
ncbi:hypothetical protein DW322_01450 [Rhodococcus rhodnii]|uniref:Uncharacterized protein n=2 Tax=Rhodococcus rhodnii TaxID=38312 RepID=R7WKC3_9NOCA|nr:permease prefix domain 1-containing protein [Rhodococcus rhodnii]EOM74454.1 hypothetical protein Rrhod_4256 [Rhodococcus rhodnii LMG 5362]TXG89152.1 hypothetical protein DW322_01450 [Rhodococcus rhodnii]